VKFPTGKDKNKQNIAMKKLYVIILMICGLITDASGCTSAIVSGKLTRSGRPLMWKHRDTSKLDNFVERVAAKDGNMGFVAIFNGGDSLLTQAWTGFNDSGFAIMNTASYNLAPDTASFKDREGFVMRMALERCRTLADFEKLLNTLPRPMGVQANFGVLDSEGKGAYYETNDYGFKRFLLDDEPNGILIRTNYSLSGEKDGGYGYIRKANAEHQLKDAIERHDITPQLFTDTISVRFYHSVLGGDFTDDNNIGFVIDQDFIPRGSSTASIVIDSNGADGIMWTELGYPPVAHTEKVTLDSVPEQLRPILPGALSPESNAALERKKKVFSITRGSGPKYVNLKALREISDEQRRLSAKSYSNN